MLWVVVVFVFVLIPKGSGEYRYRGIGLLDPLWKVIECLIDARLNAIQFHVHDCLHGFVRKRGCGTGTAVLEAKLVQQLSYLRLRQAPMFGVFIDLEKAYDAMDRDRCIQILKGYGYGAGDKDKEEGLDQIRSDGVDDSSAVQ